MRCVEDGSKAQLTDAVLELRSDIQALGRCKALRMAKQQEVATLSREIRSIERRLLVNCSHTWEVVGANRRCARCGVML